METILALCAHPDDEVFGLGGTIAKYSKEGKKTITVIFSYGEKALPLLKEEEVRKIRKNETLEAAKIIGTSETIFLGLEEGKFNKATKDSVEKIKKLIEKEKPTKIFTHSMDDPHIDHRATHALVMKILKDINYEGEVYAFEVWNPITFRKRNNPKLFVDITSTFKIKLKAIKQFETQKVQGRWPLTPMVITKALFYGFQSNCTYAERFYKISE